MDKSGAASYVYAKACGMLGKAYVGKNAVKLFNAKSLSDLWALIFTEPVPVVPEMLLANQIEYEAVKRFVSQYSHLLENYSSPDSFPVELLRRYEIENLKVFAASLSMGETKAPRIVDIGNYSVLDYSGWPDLSKITKDSPFEWYNAVPRIAERQKLDYALDLQEIKNLWSALNHVSDGTKGVLVDFFREIYSIKNLLWTLRLRVYYNFKKEAVEENLFYVGDAPSKSDPICAYAYEILDWELDSFPVWSKWRFAGYLNRHEEGEVWSIDPMVVEQNFRYFEAAKTKKLFHQYPMTDVTLVMFFRIKQQELDCIRAATERLRLNADKNEAMYVAGVKPDALEHDIER